MVTLVVQPIERVKRMFKKIMLYTSLALSFGLTLVVFVDWCINQGILSHHFILRSLVMGVLLLSVLFTMITFVTPSLRRLRLLTIDLVQTLLGGGYTVYWVYDSCFPGKLSGGIPSPLILIIVLLMTIIHSAAILIGVYLGGKNESYTAPRIQYADDLSPSRMPKRKALISADAEQPGNPKPIKPSGKEKIAANMANRLPEAEADPETSAIFDAHTLREAAKTQTVEIRASATQCKADASESAESVGAETATMPIVLPVRSVCSADSQESLDQTAAFVPLATQQTQTIVLELPIHPNDEK